MALILTLNAGSSSVKFAVFPAEAEAPSLARGEIDGIGATVRFKAAVGAARPQEVELDAGAPQDQEAAVLVILDWIRRKTGGADIAAVGHRVVHGGLAFAHPVVVDAEVERELVALARLAPLHQPHNLAGLRAAKAAFPDVMQVACFDTAFHRGHPFVADVYALPMSFYDEGVRRYGFHGLSYEYVAGALRDLDPRRAGGKVVIAHLGNGASMCAVQGGRSVASTMGFTALEGLPMGTRCGEIDPGVVLYLQQDKGLSAAEVYDLLYRKSGLLGLSGVSHDMRLLEASGHPHARQAIDYFVYRARRELGAMAAVLGGIDLVAFTGGIGENSATIRARICSGMDWLGIRLDEAANRSGATAIAARESAVAVYVVATDEERVIARHTHALLERCGAGSGRL
jgi:acetate kinase